MDSAALIVLILCAALGGIGLNLVKDPQERALLTRLFFAALGVRALFTIAFYATGLVNMLGGADDTGWNTMWQDASMWHNYGPSGLGVVYDPEVIKGNNGWRFFGTYFYFFLNARSQMALAFFNCFANSVLVLVIYKSARLFFSSKACVFVSWVAVCMPGFLTWSALTVKEPWLILFEISTFYAIWRLSRERNPLLLLGFASLAIGLVALSLGFRFYVAGFLLIGIVMTLMSCWAYRPVRAAGAGLGVVAVMFLGLNTMGLFQIDLASMTQSRVAELNTFRSNISDASQSGTNSGVTFEFDTSTATGALLMLGAGSVYLLLSPFPWQINSLGQLAALPDVLLWWWLVFVLIVPGIRHCWKHQQALLISVVAFVLPLFLFYAFIFGNVGLAYRQRAQLMPFFLVLAAAGYERREQQKRARILSAPRNPQPAPRARYAPQVVVFGLNDTHTTLEEAE